MASPYGELLDMLTYQRPKDSGAEKAFCLRYIASIPGALQDIHGNWHVVIGDNPANLWSCHTDTVHMMSGRQTITVDALGIASLSRRSKLHGANCLGADDTAGVWLCRQLALRGVTGHYIFHYGEERGGIGSSALTAVSSHLVDGITCAIALDRRGTDDVITHQFGRCASQAFARALADALNVHDFMYAPSDEGIFTDTANYVDLVPECTNLSVGYQHEHSTWETLDTGHLQRLLDALSTLDTTRLPIERDLDDQGYAGGYSHVVEWDRYTDADVRVDRPLGYTHADICNYCGDDYDALLSQADDIDQFCSVHCEEQYALWLKNETSCYLRPEYGDVQKALRRYREK